VRLRGFFLVLAVTAACGDKSGPPRGPAAEVPSSAPLGHPDVRASAGPGLELVPPRAKMGAQAVALVDPASEAAPVGHLERRDRLVSFFQSLARLEAGAASDDVRIVQFGDSHTAADLGTSIFRRALQARFGDGGRGFVSVGKPWKSYAQDGVRGGMTDGFEPVRVKFHRGQFEGVDGCYGLLGVGIGASKAGERAWTDVGAPTSRIEIDYWQEPAGGSFDVFVDGASSGRVVTRAPKAASGFYGVDLTDAPHQIELRTVGDGEVRVFGMALDRAQTGVVVDALGINGAQTSTALRWNEEHFAEQLRHRAPSLVVLAYGTNESLETKLSDLDYERAIVDLLGRIARATPAASCLLLGPTDRAAHTGPPDGWASAPRLAEIVQLQRRVARAAGCAFYDQLEAMGGPGSIVAWAAEPDPRASRDHVHLTRSGYAQLGTSLADDLLHAYDDWRAEQRLPPTVARRTGDVAIR
jgi:lysophospholipase L1-like esterase